MGPESAGDRCHRQVERKEESRGGNIRDDARTAGHYLGLIVCANPHDKSETKAENLRECLREE